MCVTNKNKVGCEKDTFSRATCILVCGCHIIITLQFCRSRGRTILFFWSFIFHSFSLFFFLYMGPYNSNRFFPGHFHQIHHSQPKHSLFENKIQWPWSSKELASKNIQFNIYTPSQQMRDSFAQMLSYPPAMGYAQHPSPAPPMSPSDSSSKVHDHIRHACLWSPPSLWMRWLNNTLQHMIYVISTQSKILWVFI